MVHKEGTDAYEDALTAFLTSNPQYLAEDALPPTLTKWADAYIERQIDGVIRVEDPIVCPPRRVRNFSDNDHWQGTYRFDDKGKPITALNGDEVAFLLAAHKKVQQEKKSERVKNQ